jgi:trehalose synthase
MTHLEEVDIGRQSIERYRPLVEADRFEALLRQADDLKGKLRGRVLWNVNSTSRGGGVAEMLRPLLAYVRGHDVDARWVVVRGDEGFFAFTKRLHHALHGSTGDGSPIDESRRKTYERVTAENAHELLSLVSPGDVVLLHDPQTAGLIPHVRRAGAHAIWRCHIGSDVINAEAKAAWGFLEGYLVEAERLVFSRKAYVPPGVDHEKVVIVAPSIDAFSTKNQDMSAETARAILVHAGIVEGPRGEGGRGFTREDGSPGRVDRKADVVRQGRSPTWDTPLVVQVSRWDSLKDPIGVMQGFADLADGSVPAGAQLVLAGPNVSAVSDDPEGAVTFDAVEAAWRNLPHGVRSIIQLVTLPMADAEENAAMVNALQRHAAVVVQKSLNEGFGLTVTEAMWKGKPVIASRIGGIQDQIEHGVNGLLLDDPRDLTAFGKLVEQALTDQELATKLATNARETVRDRYLATRTIEELGQLIHDVIVAESNTD